VPCALSWEQYAEPGIMRTCPLEAVALPLCG
jgi:hypothetical protein